MVQTSWPLRIPSKLYELLKRGYERQVEGTGLALFRLVFCTVLLAEVLHVFYFRHLIFDVVPFVQPAEIGFTTPLLLWMGTLLCLILGLYTRPAALANYVFCVSLFSSLKTYAYMVTPVYTGISFLFLFLPISRCWSLDRLRRSVRYSTATQAYTPPTTVSQLAYATPLLVGIAFVYFDSALYKLTSPLWLAGLGMWKPLSLPYETPFNNSWILNQELLVKFLGYLTLAFELAFLFLLPFRRFRLPLIVLGIGLHVGVLVSLPVPFFALGFGSLYLLLIPNAWWRSGRRVPRTASPQLTVYYDAQSPLCLRVRWLVEVLDGPGRVQFRSLQAAAALAPALRARSGQDLLANVHGVGAQGQLSHGWNTLLQVGQAIPYLRPLAWLGQLPGLQQLGQAGYRLVAQARSREPQVGDSYAACSQPSPPEKAPALLRASSVHQLQFLGAIGGLLFLTLLQGLVSYNTPIIKLLRHHAPVDKTRIGQLLFHVSKAVEQPARHLFGIAPHPITLDEHFAGYTHLVAVTYTGTDGIERFLPITRPDGQPGRYLLGAIWLKWTYSVVSAQVNQQQLENGLRSFTAFWAHQQQIDLNNCRFKVKVKRIAEPQHWQRDFLNQQLQAPWQEAGVVIWHHQQFTAQLTPIESL